MLVALPAADASYRWGWDPHDTGGTLDIRVASYARHVDPHGRRWVVTKLQFYPSHADNLDPVANWALDVSGGPKADAYVWMRYEPASVSGCVVYSRTGSKLYDTRRVRAGDTWLACSVPRRVLQPGKRPRWRAASGEPDTFPDLAPDVGWYS
jgi:hypothetical protein